MMGINIVTKVIVVAAVIAICIIPPCRLAISDRRLCYDAKCSVLVSTASTIMAYPSNDPEILSFASNIEVKVFSKGAGKRKDLWGVEIDGKRGYVPSRMLREKKVVHKRLLHEVPTETVAAEITSDNFKIEEAEKPNNVPNVPDLVEVQQESQKSDKIRDTRSTPELERVSPSYEIHDGTTIPFSGNEEPSEPSYATQVLQGVVDIGEQPILSIHPNIASTVTIKTDQLLFEEAKDAETYSDSTRSTEASMSSEVAEEVASSETELPNKAVASEESVNEEIKAIVEGVAKELSSIEGIKISAVATEEPDTPSNHENAEKTLAEDADDTDDDREEQGEDSENDNPDEEDAVDIQETAEERNTSVSDPKTIEQEIEVIVEKSIDFSTEVVAPPSSNVHAEKETNSAAETIFSTLENVLEENSTTDDNSRATVESGVTEKLDENLLPNVEAIDSSNGGNEMRLEDTVSPAVVGESRVAQSEQLVEEKTEGVLPTNLKIMSPLFNRLSKLPSIVKGVVDNVISGSPANEIPTGSEGIVVDFEAKTSTEDNLNTKESSGPAIEQPSSRPVDFSTDINTNNDDHNDNLVQAEAVPEKEAEINSIKETSNTEESLSPPVDFGTEILYSNGHHNETESSMLASERGKINERDEFFSNYESIEKDNSTNDNTADSADAQTSQETRTALPVQPGIYKEDELTGFREDNVAIDDTLSFNGFPGNRNLLNVGSTLQPENSAQLSDETATTVAAPVIDRSETGKVPKVGDERIVEATTESTSSQYDADILGSKEQKVVVEEVTRNEWDEENHSFLHEGDATAEDEITSSIKIGRNFWETFSYVVLTAFTTLLFSLGYYYIENTRRDGQLIAKINKLEKELLVSSKECTVLDDTLKSTKCKLDSIEDESFGSNEMVVSLKADLEASKIAKSELEEQVAMLEKELESATEAGLELERMLREILSTNNEDNPLAQSVEDLQTRLNAQQAANEALTNSLNLKAQENENLTSDLATMTQKCEQLEVEVTRITAELKHQNNIKRNMEQNMLDKVEHLEKQMKDLSVERINLRKQLKGKEIEMKDLLEVVDQMNINNLDFEKLYNVSSIKAEASQLLEERDDLKIRLSEVEGAHQLLEEHMKLISEEVSSLSEQSKLADKAKRDAETRVEVLSNFFKEKEAQRQKEEAAWLEKQGEVSSTVERLHTMQNEIHNYKQQIEMLKREILDQEREYKNQIASLETKSHEQWVIARQHERRLEESKAEAGQLRNRLTLIEKNLNDTDPEAKLHRLEANGETVTSPQLFMGAEASCSPIMFTGPSGVPMPPPPSYLYGPPVPPFMPPLPSSGIPPYEVGQRPPPLGGRLSSPPPHHGSSSSRYDNPRSPPPPLSPSMLPPYGPPPHRAYPPSFANDRIHPPMPPPHSSMLPPPIGGPSHNWGDDTLPPLRNSGFQLHQQHHRDQQRARNHKGSLHSSGESLDKNV